ncbi:hypothetical protein WJX73_000594 [Symbiochloris irregularis]|uniref:Equilibrative nucleoside transporter n=1 Tax=Symbiochloris irregularis TaxID=706552 RepID=A0AAW1NUG0_9CHLO
MADDQPTTSGRITDSPARRFDAGYGVFYCLGVGLLAPWNAFITATDFYEAQYPGKHADRLFTICYLPTQLIVLALLMLGQDQTRLRLRIAAGLGGFCLVMFSIPSLDLFSGGALPLWVPLLAVCVTAICDGFAQGSLYAEAAAYPAIYTQALVAGTAASGAVLSVLRCVTKAALPHTRSGLRASADVYFAVATAICLACFTAYFYALPRLNEQLPTQRMPMSQAAIGYHTASELADVTDQVEHRVLAEDVKFQELGDWYPIALITLFNFADLGGKSLPAHPSLILTSHNIILAASCARTLVIPLFYIAAQQSLGPIVIGSLTLVLGLSNGYCTAVAMMAAPIGLKGEEAAMAGQLVVFALIFGLCIGAALSFLWLL